MVPWELRRAAEPEFRVVEWTISDGAAFARRAQLLSQAKGEPPGSRASVVGVKLHMHRDVGICSIGHDELAAFSA